MEIVFNNVTHIYNPKTPLAKKALDKVNLTIQDKMINGIIGKSGSGKTTLLEMMNALILPTTGNIKIDKYTIKKNHKIKDINEIRFKVGVVLSSPEEQFFNATVYDEIAFGMKSFKYRLDKIKEHVANALLMVGLDNSYLERDPFTLSNGEKRKVALASVLAYNPEVVVLDEPTMGLDDKSKKNLWRIIRTLKTRYHKTIVLVTKDIDMLHKIVDNVIVMHDGKVVMEGNKYDVFKEEFKLNEYGVKAPKIISFSNKVLEAKDIKIGYRDEINDLIKDIYRYVK
jgi:energy-coupling factor transport system ATP-binding protein